MAWESKLRKIVENVARVLAVELVAASQAIELRTPLHPSPATVAVVGKLRQIVPHLEADRQLSPDLEAATQLILDGSIVNAAGGVVQLDV